MNRKKTFAIGWVVFMLLLDCPPAVFCSQTGPRGQTATLSGHRTPAVENHGNGHGRAQLGGELPLWSCIPFACMLLSIALFPLAAPEFWHHHFGKISAFWTVSMGAPFLIVYRGTALYEILHVILADYVPFIILLWALYTVSGGILLRGTLRGTPLMNVVMLATGTLLASWMGTTGAAMLLIRPFLRANNYRKRRTFMVVFFIFLVANIGGSLTPLGDPPLFLGFLHGVTFFWTLKLLPHMLLMVFLLLGIYFCADLYFYKKERAIAPDNKAPLQLVGIHNFLFIGGIVGAVLMSGTVDWGRLNTFGVHRAVQDWVRDGMIVLLGILSLVTTPSVIREDNSFTWFPIVEVACLFIGIFVTMIPCLLILKAGPNGGLAFLVNSVKDPVHYFWVTGALSGFLDNAPTYLTFFNTAVGGFFPGLTETQAVPLLMSEKAIYLEAICRRRLFRGLQLYRKRTQLHGAIHRGGGGDSHAELFRVCFQIRARAVDPCLYCRNGRLFSITITKKIDPCHKKRTSKTRFLTATSPSSAGVDSVKVF